MVDYSGREALESKRVVVHMRGHRQRDESLWAVAALEAAGAGAQAEPSTFEAVEGDVELFWHIGCHCFAPYASGFKPLVLKKHLADDPDHCMLLEVVGSILQH